jgi:hypothetical protein
VGYQVIQVVYFEPGRVPSGPEFAQIWSGMEVFGKHRASGTFWRSGDVAPIPKRRRMGLGSLEFLKPLLEQGTAPIYGGAAVVRRNAARDPSIGPDLDFVLNEASRWQGVETLPYLSLAISGDWFEKAGTDAVVEKLRGHLELVDRHSPCYGLIDLATPEDGWSGMVYGSAWIQNAPLHRWVEQGNWVRAASRKRDRARGIYWGNYFGPALLKRLGGREPFVWRFLEAVRLRNATPSALLWEFSNGVFVSLCLDPLDCKPGAPLSFSAQQNLTWLQNELGARGALNAWDRDEAMNDQPDPKRQFPETPPGRPEAGVTQADRSQQTFSELNEAEEQWIQDCLARARALAQTCLAPDAPPVLAPDVLDHVYGLWLAQWQNGLASEDPNTVVNATGIAFGQWLVDSLGMEWTVVSDALGTDMGVRSRARENQMVVFPTHLVAKRLQTRETAFFEQLFLVISDQVSQPRQ